MAYVGAAAKGVTTILLFFDAKDKPLKVAVLACVPRLSGHLPMWRQRGL
jgi:hypothetical protein